MFDFLDMVRPPRPRGLASLLEVSGLVFVPDSSPNGACAIPEPGKGAVTWGPIGEKNLSLNGLAAWGTEP